MGAMWYDFDNDLAAAELKYHWRKEFALDFDDVVPAFNTNVLLVEDDLATSQIIKAIIKRAIGSSVRIRSFFSGEKAGEYINSLRKNNLPGPDLAIIDYRLTGETDGLWLCRLLNTKFPDTQAILTSTMSRSQIDEKMSRYQLNTIYMQKPLDPKYLQGLFAI